MVLGTGACAQIKVDGRKQIRTSINRAKQKIAYCVAAPKRC